MNSMKVDVHRIMVLFLLSIYSLISTYSRAQDAAFLDWVIQTEGEGNMLGHQIRGSATDGAGNIIIVGGFTHTVNFNPLHDDYSIVTPNQDTLKNYMAKYSVEGELLWINLFDGIVFEHVKTDDEGNIYIAGVVYDSVDLDPSEDSVLVTGSGNDPFLASYDSEGAFRWVVDFTQVTSGYRSIQDLTVCNETQEISFTGRFYGIIDFHPDEDIEVIHDTGSSNGPFIYLANFSLDGEYKWVNVMDNSKTNPQLHRNYRLTNDEEGNIYFSGSFSDSLQLDPDNETALVLSENNERENFIAKYANNGEFLWCSSTQDAGSAITGVFYNSGSIFVSGACYHDFSFFSSVQDSTTLIQTDETVHRSFMIIEIDAVSSEIKQSILLKASGNIRGAIGYLAFDMHNNIYASGTFSYTGGVDFNPFDDDEFVITQNSLHSETFLAKYSSQGTFQWAFGMPEGVFTTNSDLALLPDGSVVVTGEYRGTADVSAYGEEPIYISTDFSPSINHHSFIAKYSQGFLSTLEEGDTNKEIVVYPNPTTHTHTIKLKGLNSEHVTVSLFDLQGRHLGEVYNGQISNENTSIQHDVSYLASGLYLYGIQLNSEKRTLRFIKQ